jgi:hypothetical protein
LLPNYVAILFLRVLATGSGGKTQTQRVWAWVLFCHPNSLWFEFGCEIRVRVWVV